MCIVGSVIKVIPYFEVIDRGSQIQVNNSKNIDIYNIRLFYNHMLFGTYSTFQQLIIKKPTLIEPAILTLQANLYHNGFFYNIIEPFHIQRYNGEQSLSREVTYEAGDILVACDNANGLPYGYMGHSALVVDKEHIIEAVTTSPIVKKVKIEKFTSDHPNHAQFRPKSHKKGEKAANYALNYLQTFKQNKEKNIDKPVFYLALETPLTDEWTYIYCSKLIWLSYYYGADYEFHNDHLWFSPEDLYANLKDNPHFDLIYIHPNFSFQLDS